MSTRLIVLIAVIFLSQAIAGGAPVQSQAAMQAEFEAKARQLEFESRRMQQQMQEKLKEAERAKTRHTSTQRTQRPQAIRQQPAQAAATFIQRARTASSANQLLSLMSYQRQQQLKERESSYDPKSARENVERMTRLLERPLTAEEKLQFGSSPFANELSSLKQIAGKAISVKSQSISDGRATVTVWTHNLARDPNYRYGLGSYRFVAEGGAWKFDSYEDSGSFFSSMD